MLMLRSLPRASGYALDTLYERHAVFSQFLGSASMTLIPFFLSMLPLLVFLNFLAFLVFFPFFPLFFRLFAFLSFLSFPLSSSIFFVFFSN